MFCFNNFYFSNPTFKGRRQEDSQEFLVCLLQAIIEEQEHFYKHKTNRSSLERSISKNETLTFEQLFHGSIVNILSCQECSTKTMKKEDFYFISLPFPERFSQKKHRKKSPQSISPKRDEIKKRQHMKVLSLIANDCF